MDLINLDTAEPSELRTYLSENFGIDKAANTAREKLVAAILEQEQAVGISRNQDNSASEPAKTGAPTSEQREINKTPRVKVKISRDPNSKGNDDVYASVNGVAYILQREKVVEVPRPVYEVILQAQETRYEQDEAGNLLPRMVQSYPIRLVG